MRRYFAATTSATEDTKTCSNITFIAGKSKQVKTIKTIVDSIQVLENLQFFSKGSAAALDKPRKRSEVNRAIAVSEGEEEEVVEEEEEKEKEEESTDFAVKIDYIASASSSKTMTNNPGLKVYIGKANVSYSVTDLCNMVVNYDCLFRERLLAMISAVS